MLNKEELKIRYLSDGLLDYISVQEIMNKIVKEMNSPKATKDEIANCFLILRDSLLGEMRDFVKYAYNNGARVNPYWVNFLTLFSNVSLNMAVCSFKLEEYSSVTDWVAIAAEYFPKSRNESEHYDEYIERCDYLRYKALLEQGLASSVSLKDILKQSPKTIDEQMYAISQMGKGQPQKESQAKKRDVPSAPKPINGLIERLTSDEPVKVTAERSSIRSGARKFSTRKPEPESTLDHMNSKSVVASTQYSSNFKQVNTMVDKNIINVRGNSVGNLANGGFVSGCADWIYYQGKDGLYKIRKDLTQKMILTHGNVGYINVYKDWIYCKRNDGLYKIKTDGSENQKLQSEINILGVSLIGDWIFYTCGTHHSSQGGTFKIRLDGSERQKLSIDTAVSMNVLDEWIYYVGPGFGNGKLYKVRTDGTDRQIIKSGIGTGIVVVDKWIYFLNLNTWSGRLDKIRIDGEGHSAVANVYPWKINIQGNYFYYLDGKGGKESGGLFRVRVDGTDNSKIAHPNRDSFQGINILDDWIYYHDINGLMRMHINGAERQLIPR